MIRITRLLWCLSLMLGAIPAAAVALQLVQKIDCSLDGSCDLEGSVAIGLFVAIWVLLFIAGSMALSDLRYRLRRLKGLPH